MRLAIDLENARRVLEGADLEVFEALIAKPNKDVDPVEYVRNWVEGKSVSGPASEISEGQRSDHHIKEEMECDVELEDVPLGEGH